jgi:hypothetical protein
MTGRSAWGAGLWALAVMTISAGEVDAGILPLTATSNATAESPTGNGTYSVLFTGNITDLVVRQFPSTVQDVALMLFDLTSVPKNVTITGVSFGFQEVVETTNLGRVVDIEGFTPSGPLSLADATSQGTLLGQYDNVALGLGVHSVALSTSGFLGVPTFGNSIGIRLQGDVDGVNTAISSLFAATSFGQAPPQLFITFAPVPEPSSLSMIVTAGLVGLIGYRWRRSARRK